MTRVASFSHNQALIDQLLRNQERVFDAQLQVVSGKKAQTYSGLPREAATLMGAKSLQTRTEHYIATTKEVSGRLENYDLNLTGMAANMEDLRQRMLDAIANKSAFGFDDSLAQTFESLVTSLNSQLGGIHLFSGSRTDMEAVTFDTMSDLLAAGSPADGFANNADKLAAKIDDGAVLEYGILAEDVALDAFTVLRDLANAVTGPFDGDLSDAQIAELTGFIGQIEAARDVFTNAAVENGNRAQRLDQVIVQHESQTTFLETFISDIEDVDIAEAITRLNNNQTALEASYQVLSRLSDLSLLRFL